MNIPLGSVPEDFPEILREIVKSNVFIVSRGKLGYFVYFNVNQHSLPKFDKIPTNILTILMQAIKTRV